MVRRSLGNKVVVLLVGFALVLCGVALTVSYTVINRMNEDSYRARADEVAALTARSLDADDLAAVRAEVERVYDRLGEKVLSDRWGTPEFNAYIAEFAHVAEMDEFKRMLETLSRLQEAVDVDCLYTGYIDQEDARLVYLVDAADEGACPPGTLDPVYEVNAEVLTNVERGFPAYVTDTPEYGWLVTAGVPVYDGDDEVVAYALVDVSMDAVKANQWEYVWLLSWLLLGITCVLGVVAGLLARRFVTAPLNTLSGVAARYRTRGGGRRPSFASLEIHTGDEIESLLRSMVTMEHDIDTYIENLLDTETQLAKSRQRAEALSDLARTDALTGALNRLAFDQTIAALDMSIAGGNRDVGIAVCDLNDLKVTNDTYGHEYGNELLVNLVVLMREAFPNSAIYRIGGDEFAVVFTGGEFASAGKQVAAFEVRVAELRADERDLKPWERVSAAIGYASFDPAFDADSSGVFDRADHAMYLRKREMKGRREVR